MHVDRAFSVVLPSDEHDPAAAARRSPACIPEDPIAADVDPGSEHRSSVRRREVEKDSGSGIARDDVVVDLDVERRLASVRSRDVETGGRPTAPTGEGVPLDAKTDRPKSRDHGALTT